ncbi:MAG TPA: TRAP transporter small permease [Syntrophorhabdaceae bacterium]|nr:TRAP transporter small permease [Syntrophorhabdaceae bacterium]HNT69524.1 TRAP transporter small permease [Syntrophorhabdaceae bacterium]
MKYLVRLNNFLNKIMIILGGISVLCLMTLATGNVVLRIFQAPFGGAYEIVSFIGAMVIAFALGYTQKMKNHIVVDILTEKFPKKLHRVLDAVNYFVTMIFFGLITWQILAYALKVQQTGELSETLKIIYYPFVYSVSAGFAVLTLTLLVDFLNSLLGKEEN